MEGTVCYVEATDPMTSPTRYPVPARTHHVEEEIKRSRFITTIGRAATPDEASAFVSRVSEQFADATHNCWAYVVGPPGNTDRIGMSDSGEPHGTAGRPMLNALLHAGVGDVVVVVTRYFGGTKLGMGGLVRAYTGCVQHALATLPLSERVELVALTVVVDYTRVTTVQRLFPAFEVEVASQSFAADARYDLRLPSARLDGFRAAVLDATRGQARISAGE
jgi:uncharacterized YigZ family protein